MPDRQIRCLFAVGPAQTNPAQPVEYAIQHVSRDEWRGIEPAHPERFNVCWLLHGAGR